MIEPASAIGFLLVLLAASVLGSLVLCTLLLTARRALRALGSGAERLASFLALVLPPALALAVTLVLAGRSLLGPWFGLDDHCPEHAEHLHLCLRHGAAWSRHAWAIASLLAVLTYLAVRIGFRLLSLVRTSRAFARLAAIGEPMREQPDVLIVDARQTFSFAAGIPVARIVLSSAAWERLAPVERAAVIEHERAHVRQRDLWLRLLLDLAVLFGAPFLGARVLSMWEDATERLCDRRAALRIGDPSAVASALVKMARAARQDRKLGLASFSSPRIAERVEALLAGEPEGRLAQRRLAHAALLALALAISSFVLLADPIHHGLEHLLGAG